MIYIPPYNDHKHQLRQDFPIMEAVSKEGVLNLEKPVLFFFFLFFF